MAKAWYAYIAGTTGDPLIAGNYRKMTTTPGCVNGPFICAIYVEDGDDTPLSPLNFKIARYIVDGLANGVAEPQFPLAGKKYVYLKSAVGI